jgi:hypothetical protein
MKMQQELEDIFGKITAFLEGLSQPRTQKVGDCQRPYEDYMDLYTKIYNLTLTSRNAQQQPRFLLREVDQFVGANLPKWSANQRKLAAAVFRYLCPGKQNYEEAEFPNLASIFQASSPT